MKKKKSSIAFCFFNYFFCLKCSPILYKNWMIFIFQRHEELNSRIFLLGKYHIILILIRRIFNIISVYLICCENRSTDYIGFADSHMSGCQKSRCQRYHACNQFKIDICNALCPYSKLAKKRQDLNKSHFVSIVCLQTNRFDAYMHEVLVFYFFAVWNRV